MNNTFTEQQIIEWLGDPDWSFSGIVETFVDLANGDYTVENMRKDILEHPDNEKEKESGSAVQY